MDESSMQSNAVQSNAMQRIARIQPALEALSAKLNQLNESMQSLEKTLTSVEELAEEMRRSDVIYRNLTRGNSCDELSD